MVKRPASGPACEIASEPAPHGRWSRPVVPNDDVATTCRLWPQKMKGDAMAPHLASTHRPPRYPKPSPHRVSEPKYRTNMCRNTTLKRSASTEVGNPSKQMLDNNKSAATAENAAAPSILARYTCASILVGFFAVWGKYTFVPEAEQPGVHVPMHSYKVPLALTVGYLISLPILRYAVENFVSKKTDMKVLLTESMVLVRCRVSCIHHILVPNVLYPILIIGKVQFTCK